MVSWLETITGFLIAKVLVSEVLLTNAVEDFLDTALVRMDMIQGTILPLIGGDLNES